MRKWQHIDIEALEYVGLIELENDQDFANFEIYKNSEFIVFGSHTNAMFLQSGNYKIDDCFSFDENLQEFIADLESFYSDGNGFQSEAFCCNDRM
jgi:hypothetical protein